MQECSMTTIEISQTGAKCSIPSSWDELSPDQVCHILQLYDKSVRLGWSLLDFNVRVLYYLMGIKYNWCSVRWEKLADKAVVAERNANVYMLCEKCLGWLLKEYDDPDAEGNEKKRVLLAYNSVVNALPSIKPGLFRRRLYGPADALQDLSFGEFRHASTALNTFFKTHNIDDLDECIAHLYRARARRPNRAGRYVAAIDNENITVARRRVARLHSWQKTLIMLWLSSCINFLQTGTVSIDGEDIDMSKLFSGGKSDSSVLSCTWQDLAIEIAKEQTIGNIERVDEEPLYSIISIMWHNHKENKRNEKIGKA